LAEEQDKKQSLEAWLAEERQRLDQGFTYEPPPPLEDNPPDAAQDILAQMGLGAGVLAGIVAGHANPVTFDGCTASTMEEALVSHVSGGDTRVSVEHTENATVVTLLQSQAGGPHGFLPALTVTLIQTGETLTVAMSDLSGDARRGAIGSLGKAALHGGQRLLLRRRGLAGALDAAGGLMETIERASEDIEDLGLPRRTWAIIDQVGEAAEITYWQEQRKRGIRERRREAAERAWTHCEYCGRAFGEDGEDGQSIVQCPSCGAPRGPKPAWLD